MDFLLEWDFSNSSPSYLYNTANSEINFTRDIVCFWSSGFIANRIDLCNRIAQNPNTITDLNLILKLYQEYGYNAASLVEGFYSWIIWDGLKQEIIATRDRLGLFGLYYRLTSSNVLISNLPERLINGNSLHPDEINSYSVVAYLHGKAPLEGQTFFRDVYACKPGETLIFRRNTYETRRYWKIEPQPTLHLKSDADYADYLRSLFFTIIREYSDSPKTGVMLSGGLDSTSIASAIRSTHPESELLLFTFVTTELPEADESEYAFEVARFLNIEPHLIRADLLWTFRSDSLKTSASTPFLLPYPDLWDGSLKLVRDLQISILFNGGGGDHLFGDEVYAYPDLFLSGRWLQLMSQINAQLPTSKLGLLGIIRLMLLGPILWSYIPQSLTNRPQMESWVNKQYTETYYAYTHIRERELGIPFFMLPGKKQRYRLLDTAQISQIFEKIVLLAQEYNIEIRFPWLDRRLIEFALSLPTTQTFQSGVRKVILRRAMENHLPIKVLSRKTKTSLSPVFKRGVIEREQKKIWHLLRNMRAAELGFVDETGLQQLYSDYINQKTNNTRFWYALTLESWLRQHFS